jgi:hypothetical protein
MTIAVSWVEAECLPGCLASAHVCQNGPVFEPKPLAPYDHGRGCTVLGHHYVGPLVAVLFFPGRPAAVLRRVRSVIVNPVQRVRWRRTAAHVREKRFVRPSPSIAHGDSAAAIVRPTRQGLVGAPGLHIGPSAMLGRAIGLTVGGFRRPDLRRLHASARRRNAAAYLVAERCHHQDTLDATCTATSDSLPLPRAMAKANLDHGPIAECLTEHHAH